MVFGRSSCDWHQGVRGDPSTIRPRSALTDEGALATLVGVLYNAAVQLVTLGGLRLEGSGFTRPKPLLLLCYLALEGAQSRRVLAELFFRDTRNPRDALSTTYRRLRALGDGLAVADGDRLGTVVACDAGELLAALEGGDGEAALPLYRGAFLAGFDLALGEELEEWVFATREFLALRVREAHLRLGEGLLSRGEAGAAARRAEAAYRLAGAPELEPEDFGRLYRLLAAGRSPSVAEVRAEANRFGIEITAPPPSEKRRVASRADLPAPTDAFVGRDPELLEIAKLMGDPDVRLVTLQGPGGVGKSRLALQAARNQLGEQTFPDGVSFVLLDALTSADQIPGSIAKALAITPEGAVPLPERIASHLGRSRFLLVLDNYEHLLAGAGIASDMLRACPNLKLLVTSRERLHLTEEHVMVLGGLPVPSVGSAAEDVGYVEAVQLFIRRAKKATLDFEVDADTLELIVELVRLVEGFPLAIELAAAWVRTLPLSDIVAEIASTQDLLVSAASNATDRHRSMRAAFEHSWNLLGDRDRDVLAKLSVFRGGFRREAASEVADATLASLASLVDKSLLTVSANGRFYRHSLLFRYTQEKLSERPGTELRIRERHLANYLALADRAEPHLRGKHQGVWLDRLAEEHENLREALIRSLELDPGRSGLVLAGVLSEFWKIRGYHQEGRALLERVLSHPRTQERSTARAKILDDAGSLAQAQGDHAAARTLFEDALELFRELGDRRGVARSLELMGIGAEQQGNYDTAVARHAEALAIRRQLGDDRGIGSSLLNMGNSALYRGEYGRARSLYEESTTLLEAVGDTLGLAWAHSNIGLLEEWQGNFAASRPHYEAGLALRREVGDTPGIAWSLNALGLTAFHLGDYGSARPLFEESLELKRELGDRSGIAWSLANLGLVACHQGRHAEARRLHEQSLELKRELGDRLGIAASLSNLGEVAGETGDVATARSLHEQSLAIFRELGHERGIVSALINLGGVAEQEEDHPTALSYLQRGLDLAQELGDGLRIAECLEGIALVCSRQGENERAVFLWGAAGALRERIGSPMPPPTRTEMTTAIEIVREALGAERFSDVWQEGGGAPRERAIEFARFAGEPVSGRRVVPGG